MKRWILLLGLLLVIPSQPVHAGFGIKSLKKKAKKAAKALPKPTATIKKVDLEAISFKDIDFLFVVSIKNPYPIGINLDKVTFDFAVEGHKLFSTTTKGGLKLKAKKSSDTRLKVNLTYDSIIKAVRDFSRKEHVE